MTRDTEAGKRSKKRKQRLESRLLSKRKEQEKIIKKVEESIEKFLNINDLDETPFMEYFRRASTYILFGLMPTGRKSICLLPLPVTFSFCKDELTKETLTTTELPKPILKKKLRTKKEKHAKQSISSRPSKSESTHDKIVDSVKPLSKTPIETVDKPQGKQTHRKVRSSIRRRTNEQTRHFDEEEQQIQKIIGVESPKKKSKKRFQIISKEVKIKHKHSQIPSSSTTTPSIPTTTDQIPIMRVSTPIVENSEIASFSSEVNVVSTTTSAPFRSISDIVQEEVATLLSTKSTLSEEIDESNESLQSTKTAGTSLNPNNSRISNQDNSESESIDSSESRENNENLDISPVKKIQQFFENAKESVHVMLDLKDNKNSS